MAALVGLLVVYAIAAFIPFEWDPPEYAANPVEKLGDGRGLRFTGIGVARTPRPPSWLDEVIDTGRFEARLTVTTADPDQPEMARILSLSPSHSRRNLTIGQDGSDLEVRVRMPDTDLDGLPSLRVEQVFARPGPVRISVVADGERLVVSVDGEPRASKPMPPAPLRDWDRRYRLSLGNEQDPSRETLVADCRRVGLSCTGVLDAIVASDDHAWRGVVEQAEIRTATTTIDYTTPGTLTIPESRWEFRDDPHVNVRRWRGTRRDNVVNLVGFVPLGFLLGLGPPGSRWRRRLPLVVGFTLLVSVGIEIVQFFMPDRISSYTDVVVNLSGSLLGSAIAAAALARWQAAERS